MYSRPILFIFETNYMAQTSTNTDFYPLKFINKLMPALLYADDIVLLSITIVGLRRPDKFQIYFVFSDSSSEITTKCCAVGCTIRKQKTGFMQ